MVLLSPAVLPQFPEILRNMIMQLLKLPPDRLLLIRVHRSDLGANELTLIGGGTFNNSNALVY